MLVHNESFCLKFAVFPPFLQFLQKSCQQNKDYVFGIKKLYLEAKKHEGFMQLKLSCFMFDDGRHFHFIKIL